MSEEIIDRGSRFALQRLKHRRITGSKGKASGRYGTEVMRQLYDHSMPAVEAAAKQKNEC